MSVCTDRVDIRKTWDSPRLAHTEQTNGRGRHSRRNNDPSSFTLLFLESSISLILGLRALIRAPPATVKLV